jgi:hypothetical protein
MGKPTQMERLEADRLSLGGYRHQLRQFPRVIDDVELYHQVMANLDKLEPAEMTEMVRLEVDNLLDVGLKQMIWRARLFLGLLNREVHARMTDIPGQAHLMKEC